MLRKSRSDSRHLQLGYAVLFALTALFPGVTLFSGQVIKQFESYSLARSMAENGWNPYATTVPCDGGIRWVLELPLFAGLGGIFARLFPDWPSILPVLVYGFFLFALVRLRARLAPGSSPFAWIAIAAAPVFLRFSTQFLPDPLAAALIVLGAGLFLGRDRTATGADRAASTLVFLLAVSVKPTVFPSIIFFRWAFAPERDSGKLLPPNPARWLAREGAVAAMLITPFAAWSLSVRMLGIPSPMHEGGLLAVGRDWAILGEREFYSKFFNWTAAKGVGIPLFLLALYGAFRMKDETIRRLAAWSLGVVPYWLLVRRLNVIHDYYSLSFFVPIAILGALVADRIRREGGKRALVATAFLAITVAQGTALFVRSGLANPRRAVTERPVFCGREFRSESLMGIPSGDAAR